MSNTSATRLRHECNTNGTIATRVKVLILITRRVKTYFHASILTIQLMNNYKEKNNFILKTTGNASFPCQNAFKKCTTKTELCNSESYIKKLYSRLQVQCRHNYAQYNSLVFDKTLCETNNIFLARTVQNQEKRMLDSEKTFEIKLRSRQTVFEILLTSAVICI